ncbi:hypothetical protein ACA910_022072 [Epithemia clementina (nom. ined.)]
MKEKLPPTILLQIVQDIEDHKGKYDWGSIKEFHKPYLQDPYKSYRGGKRLAESKFRYLHKLYVKGLETGNFDAYTKVCDSSFLQEDQEDKESAENSISATAATSHHWSVEDNVIDKKDKESGSRSPTQLSVIKQSPWPYKVSPKLQKPASVLGRLHKNKTPPSAAAPELVGSSSFLKKSAPAEEQQGEERRTPNHLSFSLPTRLPTTMSGTAADLVLLYTDVKFGLLGPFFITEFQNVMATEDDEVDGYDIKLGGIDM